MKSQIVYKLGKLAQSFGGWLQIPGDRLEDWGRSAWINNCDCRLCREREAVAAEPTCTWKQSKHDVSSWTSECGNKFLEAYYDLPRYCSNCGNTLAANFHPDHMEES